MVCHHVVWQIAVCHFYDLFFAYGVLSLSPLWHKQWRKVQSDTYVPRAWSLNFSVLFFFFLPFHYLFLWFVINDLPAATSRKVGYSPIYPTLLNYPALPNPLHVLSSTRYYLLCSCAIPFQFSSDYVNSVTYLNILILLLNISLLYTSP